MITVILMAYGSPTRMEDVLPYLEGIYEGKPVPEYALKENTEKYAMANGVSPSNAIIDRLVEKLQRELSKQGQFEVILGNKHWKPTLADALDKAKQSGSGKIIAMPLFPFQSVNVKNSYLEPSLEAMGKISLDAGISFVNGFDIEKLAEVWTGLMKQYPIDDETAVLFDAHSLPLFRGPENEYDGDFRKVSGLIARNLGLKEYFVGYQSRGKYGSTWLEPSVFEELEKIKSRGYRDVLAVPVGFIYEHLEILYDLDHEFGGKVRDNGIIYVRSELPNDSKQMVSLLLQHILKEAGVPNE